MFLALGIRYSRWRGVWHRLTRWRSPHDHEQGFQWSTAVLLPANPAGRDVQVLAVQRLDDARTCLYVGQGAIWHPLGRRHDPCSPAFAKTLDAMAKHSQTVTKGRTNPNLNTP